MSLDPRVVSAEFARSMDDDGPGSRAIASYLDRHVGGEYIIAEIERREGRFSLVLDADWMQLACDTNKRSPNLIEGVTLPRKAILAVIAGWRSDWRSCSSELVIDLSPDQVPHLRLVSIRHSPTGADENAERS